MKLSQKQPFDHKLDFFFRITDESLKRYSRLHRQSRFPSITWKHPKNHALLLRGSSFHGKGVMGMIRRHHDSSHHGTTAHTEMASTVEAELYITSIIQNTPRAMIRPESAWNMAGSNLSINSMVAPNDYPSGNYTFYLSKYVLLRLALTFDRFFSHGRADYLNL